MSGSSQTITKMDALQYIKEVQCAFHDSREKFDKFMDVMKDYKFHRYEQVEQQSTFQFST